MWPLSLPCAAVVMWRQPQAVCRWTMCGSSPLKLYLWTLKIELLNFHVPWNLLLLLSTVKKCVKECCKWKSRKLEILELNSHPITLNALPGGELRYSLDTVWCVSWLRHGVRLSPRQVKRQPHSWVGGWVPGTLTLFSLCPRGCLSFTEASFQSLRSMLHAPDLSLSSPVTAYVTV